MSPKAANHGGVRTLKNPDYVMSMLGADTSEGADKKKGIGELKMGCFNRPLCVRSPDFVIASPKNQGSGDRFMSQLNLVLRVWLELIRRTVEIPFFVFWGW